MMRSSFGTSSPASSSPWGELAQRREREEREEQRSTNLERQRAQHERDRALLRHLALPNIITGYVQVAFNVAVLVGVLWAMTWFARAVATDIDLKAEQFRREVASEIVTCAREYAANRCDPKERIPAMQKSCETWSNCMAQDPYQVAHAKVSAHTIAEILNSFVEPISYKTMVFFALMLLTVIVGSNVAFGIGRRTLSGGHMIAQSPDGHDGVQSRARTGSEALVKRGE